VEKYLLPTTEIILYHVEQEADKAEDEEGTYEDDDEIEPC